MRISRIIVPALLLLGMPAAPSPSHAQISVGISAGIAPPPLPVYEQPPVPGPDYMWTPGYWGWGAGGYYWVPGTWVYPPTIGLLWTPPWWGWSNGVYVFNAGYWGPEVGFYGGVDYGFGYSGHGYDGGHWDHGHFAYNRGLRGPENRVSFNGGTGGIRAEPTAQEQAAMHGRHVPATAAQLQHVNAARSNPSLLAKTNNGQPKITATSQAGRFNSTGAVTTGTTRTANTGSTGQKNLNSKTGGNPPGVTNQKVSNQVVHPQGQPHPQPQPKGQPSGKNQNKKPGQS
jgi:hypothetical protein